MLLGTLPTLQFSNLAVLLTFLLQTPAPSTAFHWHNHQHYVFLGPQFPQHPLLLSTTFPLNVKDTNELRTYEGVHELSIQNKLRHIQFSVAYSSSNKSFALN
ncbi:hypothetical protein CHARACLAT_016617 [Characodon lateralis]|uniref:Uncharacterized protein n=1 Tax=Characodon lateralis TaxID=208331 RepID=A0ABU7EAG0_9TELE|nr:hypothetical protein [Characodon lateralis]